jgi:hypothetical protein
VSISPSRAGAPGLVYALLLSGVIAAVGISVAIPEATLVAGVLALCCFMIGLALVGRTQRIVAAVLVGIGIGSLVLGVLLGGEVRGTDLLSVNQDLIGMLAAVSFLRLIAPRTHLVPARLRGRAAIFRTAVATHVLGAVLNLGAIGIVGDHLRGRGSLTMADATLISRSYSAGAFWSPFWGTAAAAAVLAPGANPLILLLVGVPTALVAICLCIWDVSREWGGRLAAYRGYSLSASLLRMPVALVLLVVVAHQLFPTVLVSRIVLLSALGVTVAGLLLREWSGLVRTVARHARHELPGLRGEVTLFVSAGILGAGLRVLFPVLNLDLPLPAFTVPVAWGSMVVIVLLAVLGVHPVVSVAVVAALVHQLHPDPTLFVLAVSIGWGLATSVGPITGLTLFMNGRYGIDTMALTRRNLAYVAVILPVAWLALMLCQALTAL